MTGEDAAHLFGALSNADRLQVIRALVEAGPGGLNAGDIAKKIGATPSRTSFHLTALADAGLVKKDRQARRQVYRVDFPRIGALVLFLLEDCCMGSAALQECCRPVWRSAGGTASG